MDIEDFRAWLSFNRFTCSSGPSWDATARYWACGPVRVLLQPDAVTIFAMSATRILWQARYAGAPYELVGHAIDRALDSTVAALLPT